MQFTHLNKYNSAVSVHSQICTAITTNLEHFHHLHPLTVTPPFPPPRPRQTLIYFLFLILLLIDLLRYRLSLICFLILHISYKLNRNMCGLL